MSARMTRCRPAAPRGDRAPPRIRHAPAPAPAAAPRAANRSAPDQPACSAAAAGRGTTARHRRRCPCRSSPPSAPCGRAGRAPPSGTGHASRRYGPRSSSRGRHSAPSPDAPRAGRGRGSAGDGRIIARSGAIVTPIAAGGGAGGGGAAQAASSSPASSGIAVCSILGLIRGPEVEEIVPLQRVTQTMLLQPAGIGPDPAFQRRFLPPGGPARSAARTART